MDTKTNQNENNASCFTRSENCEEPCYRRWLYPALARASVDKPYSFSETILAILKRYFPIKAASLYTHNGYVDQLILRAQVGLNYDSYLSFELPLDTIAGEIVKTDVPRIEEKINSSKYRDKILISKFDLSSMITVPLKVNYKHPANQLNAFGVICVYPEKNINLDHLQHCLMETVPFIARLYLTSLDSLQAVIRSQFVNKVVYSHDIGSLLHRALRVFGDLFSVEGASVFIMDKYVNTLKLCGASELPDGIKKTDIFYLEESTDPTYRVASTGKMEVLNSYSSQEFDSDVAWEKLASDKYNCLLLPIHEASVPPGSKKTVLGVLRSTNKYLSHDGIQHPVSFGWEDIYLQNYFAELLAVSIHFLKKTMIGTYEYARIMHGSRTNMVTVARNLELIDRHGLMKKNIDPKYQYILPNARDCIDDIRSQVGRLSGGNETLELKKIMLYGDVLSKFPSMIKRIATTDLLGPFKVTDLGKAGFMDIPPAKGDKNTLLRVFRNLIDNATKYCKKNTDGKYIHFSWKQTGNMIIISISDNGIGIPEDARDRIFIDGFRAYNARRRSPAGCGFGLTDSKELMNRLGGDLIYAPSPDETVFQVHVSVWDMGD